MAQVIDMNDGGDGGPQPQRRWLRNILIAIALIAFIVLAVGQYRDPESRSRKWFAEWRANQTAAEVAEKDETKVIEVGLTEAEVAKTVAEAVATAMAPYHNADEDKTVASEPEGDEPKGDEDKTVASEPEGDEPKGDEDKTVASEPEGDEPKGDEDKTVASEPEGDEPRVIRTDGIDQDGRPVIATPNGDWRVYMRQDISFPPELGEVSPGFGVAADEVGVVVGANLFVLTPDGRVDLGPSCQQLAIVPGTYCKDCGGTDFGFYGWAANPAVTEVTNELAVMSWEYAVNEIDRHDCPLVDPAEVMEHVMVVEQAEGSDTLVTLTPWHQFRRASGEDHTIMYLPGDTVYAWHIGGLDRQNDVCDGGGCYVKKAPVSGWFGGGVANSTWPGEIPADAAPLTVEQSIIEAWMKESWEPFWVN